MLCAIGIRFHACMKSLVYANRLYAEIDVSNSDNASWDDPAVHTMNFSVVKQSREGGRERFVGSNLTVGQMSM